MAPTTTTTITTVTAINTLLSVKRQKIEFRFQLFVDHLDISTLVSAKTYVTEDSGISAVAVPGGDAVTEDSGISAVAVPGGDAVTEDSDISSDISAVAVPGGYDVTKDSGLTINRVEKTRDEAMYTCSASNAVGSRSMTAYLTVNGKSLLNLCTDRPKQRRIEALISCIGCLLLHLHQYVINLFRRKVLISRLINN